MDNTVYENTLSLLIRDSDGRIRDLLSRIVEWRRLHNKQVDGIDGFEWYEVSGDPRTLNMLVTKCILEIVYKSNKSCFYRPRDLEAIEAALRDYSSSKVVEEVEEIPSDIFEVIVGHADKKDILFRAITSKKPLHVLLYGAVASAKSLFLEELSRLKNSYFVLGSRLSKAGLYEILLNVKPKYLIIDEIDKVDDQSNVSALLSLMQTGFVAEALYGRHRSAVLDTRVFAAANRIEKLPKELLSRFTILHFDEYSDREFLEVSTTVLSTREGVPKPIAEYIAKRVLYSLKSRDVRDCIKVARLALYKLNEEEVDHIIGILSKQKKS